jgi:mono/diheme cytochrome c family protein
MAVRPLLAAVPLVLALAAGACGGTEATAVLPELRQGQAVYKARCAVCHGGTGGGGIGPKLSAGLAVQRYPDVPDQVDVVRHGAASMPRFDGVLTDAEIEAVVRYTREGF